MKFLPQFYDDESRLARARDRAKTVDQLIGLKNLRVLEIGTGHGDFAFVLAEEYGCEVVATETMYQETWRNISHPMLKLMEIDICTPNVDEFPNNSFDRIVSFVVWEHLRHPFAGLQESQRILKPTGKKYLHAYLGGAPRLSHLHYKFPEPWLHLTNSPTELKYRMNASELPWYYYCNRLTHSHYLTYFRKLGFYITYENLIREPFDVDYYHSNEEFLGLFPLYDLQTHGLQVALEFDVENPKKEIPDPVYAKYK